VNLEPCNKNKSKSERKRWKNAKIYLFISVSSNQNEPRQVKQESQSGLPSYDEAVEQGSYENERAPIKKKIIPTILILIPLHLLRILPAQFPRRLFIRRTD
jgi:hypothetical protein